MKDETDYKTAYETAMIGFKMQMQEIERLNNIINKAIEYIEEAKGQDFIWTPIFMKELLNILKGE